MWGSFFSGGKDPLKDLGYEIFPDNQSTTNNPRLIWTILNGKTEKAVYVVTEKAVSLEIYLNELKLNETNFNSKHLLEIAWGLQQLCRVLIFLHDDCKLSHRNINTSTVFIDAKSCDWKLACLEFVQPINEDQIHIPSRFLPTCQRYEPPSGPSKKGRDNQK